MNEFIKDKKFLHIAGTGHRPDKLPGGYEKYFDSGLEYATELCVNYIKSKGDIPIKIISGAAQGWDTAIALAAIRLQLPLIAAIPCPNQQERWPTRSRTLYSEILEQAEEQYIISPQYSMFAMFKRNSWLVDNCDEMLAWWDGNKKGGTYNCVVYAKKQKIPITNLYGE